MSDTNKPYRPRCIHLTCKAMMVYGEDFEQDPDFEAGMAEMECMKTATNRGPDNCETSLDLCSDPRRKCYQEY